MIESLKNTYRKGWVVDKDKKAIGTDEVSDARNVEFVSDDEFSMASISPMKSMLLDFSIPPTPIQAQQFRLKWLDSVAVGIKLFNESDGVIGTMTPAVYASKSDYVDAINLFFNNIYGTGSGIFFVEEDSVGDYIRVSVSEVTSPFTFYNNYNILEDIGGDTSYAAILQYGFNSEIYLEPRQSLELDGKLFLISTDASSTVSEVGIYDGSSYVRVYRSIRTIFSYDNIIDFKGEITASLQYGLYIVDGNIKPKCLYVNTSYSEDCTQKYTTDNYSIGTDGYIILFYEDKQTDLQLLNNSVNVKFKQQNQSGGAIKSGGWRYAVRCGINSAEITTPFCFLTPNVTPVFEYSTNEPAGIVNIEGIAGVTTTKSNVLTIKNANKSVFDFVELVGVYYSGQGVAATASYIIGRYPILSNSFDIIHYGNEVYKNIELVAIPDYDPVILNANALELKKKRLNLASINLAIDEDLSAIFSSATIETELKALRTVGTLSSEKKSILIGYATTGAYDFSGSRVPFPINSAVIINQSTMYDTGTSSMTIDAGIGSTTLDIDIKAIPTLNGVEIFSNERYNVSFTVYVVKNGVDVASEYFQSNTRTESKNTNITAKVDVQTGDVIKFEYQSNYHVTKAPGAWVWSTISGITVSAFSDNLDNTVLGEYLDPENCSNYVGYMMNESYPFFARVHYKNGYISSPFYIGTHKFLWTSGNNSQRLLTSDPDIEAHRAYAYYANISGIDITDLINTADYISIWRGLCNPTILGSGIFLASDRALDNKEFVSGLYSSIPSVRGTYGLLNSATSDNRSFGLFLSPDVRKNKVKVSDGYLNVFGAPTVLNNTSAAVGPQGKIGSYAEYNGTPKAGQVTYTEFGVDSGQFMEFNSDSQLLGSSLTNIKSKYSGSINSSCVASAPGLALSIQGYVLDPNIPVGSTNPLSRDNGVYMAQYYVPQANQYDLESVQLIPTGCGIDITVDMLPGVVSVDVFGGDTYTQKSVVKISSWADKASLPFLTLPSEYNTFSSVISYYSQNRFNAQLTFINKGDQSTYDIKGFKNIYGYLFPFENKSDVVEDQFNYDEGYSAVNITNRTLSYNPRVAQTSSVIARRYFSDKKNSSSIEDTYRKIKLLSYSDLDSKNGPILGLLDIGNYIISFQPRAVTVDFYDTDAFVSTEVGSIQTTSGQVYPNNQKIVSTLGPSKKSDIINAKNSNGNPQPYWISRWAKKILRYGQDGVSIISDINGIRSYLLANLDLSSDSGIGFHLRKQQLYFTFNGITIGWNEMGNMFTGRYDFVPNRYFSYNDSLIVSNSSDLYLMSEGSDYLKYFGSLTPSQFEVESVFNKYPDWDKRPFATAFNVGHGYTGSSIIITSSDSFSSNNSDLLLRRGELIGVIKPDVNNDIFGQWVSVRLTTSEYINLFGSTLRTGVKRRLT